MFGESLEGIQVKKVRSTRSILRDREGRVRLSHSGVDKGRPGVVRSRDSLRPAHQGKKKVTIRFA